MDPSERLGQCRLQATTPNVREGKTAIDLAQHALDDVPLDLGQDLLEIVLIAVEHLAVG